MANILYDSIIARRNEMKLSKAELAEMAGVSLPTVQKLDTGDDISLASLRDICFAMDLIITTVDRSTVVQKEIDEKTAEIEAVRAQLQALEKERETLELLIKK